MSRKFLLILIALSLSFEFTIPSFSSEETACQKEAKKDCEGNKRSLPSGCYCCCKKIKDANGKDTDEYECKPTDPVTKEDGTKDCPAGTKKRTSTSGKCICKFKDNE